MTLLRLPSHVKILLRHSSADVRVRFAPSPTGYLHVGNIRTALFNYLQAKKIGAEFILRLDDTDKERSSLHFIDQINRDLEWLGINWDRVEQQSLRIERYREVLNKFKDQ